MRRTKIVCTLGPASQEREQILALAHAGMDVARLNFSYGTHDEHAARIETVRAVSERLQRPIAVLQDLQGPKLRLGRFEGGGVVLASGDAFVLTVRDVLGDEHHASVSHRTFADDVTDGATVLINDGRVRLEVRDRDQTDVRCKVIDGGKVSDHNGVNVPEATLSVDALTEKDRADLDFGLQSGVDFVAPSFVQTPADVAGVKDYIATRGKTALVVAKIERPQAVSDFEAISDAADAVMIARGDLGVEMLTEEVPPVQKHLIARCNAKGVPVITATQMLDSMIHSPRPTRAEASDVANAVLDGSDAVMLSGETAMGAFPVEAVRTMDRIVSLVEDSGDPRWDLKRRKPDFAYPADLAVGYSACHAAELVGAEAIVCLTQSGATAHMIARFRPRQPVLAVTSSPATYRRLAMLWGTSPVLTEQFRGNIDDAVEEIKRSLLSTGRIVAGSTLVFTAGLPFAHRSKPTCSA